MIVLHWLYKTDFDLEKGCRSRANLKHILNTHKELHVVFQEYLVLVQELVN